MYMSHYSLLLKGLTPSSVLYFSFLHLYLSFYKTVCSIIKSISERKGTTLHQHDKTEKITVIFKTLTYTTIIIVIDADQME